MFLGFLFFTRCRPWKLWLTFPQCILEQISNIALDYLELVLIFLAYPKLADASVICTDRNDIFLFARQSKSCTIFFDHLVGRISYPDTTVCLNALLTSSRVPQNETISYFSN